MFHSFSTLLLFSLFLIQDANPQDGFRKDYFRAPMDIEMYLSGNFGELRSNHFHSGIDIKTQGVSGHRVFAVADGYISRIKVEAAGYGNTLYVTHPGGYTSVYAHLNRFREDVAGYVRERQYQLQQHAVNIFPGKEEWPVKKGELLAFSGSSGYSFGPHLHFEIRDAANQEPMNVLRFGFDIEDLVAPKIFSLYLYPERGNGIANGLVDKTRLEVTGNGGSYRLNDGDTIEANGRVGFGIEAFDYLDGAHNRCGIYRIRMLVDGELRYDWKIDRFPFSQARYVNSYIDYEEKMRNDRLVQKLFVDPNNPLKLYAYVEDRGWIDFSQPGYYRVEFILDDVYENRSTLEICIRGNSPREIPQPETKPDPGYAASFSWSAPNEFRRDDIVLSIPERALYRDMDFHYSREPAGPGSCSPVHCMHDPSTPIHLPCEIRIRPAGLPDELQAYAYIGLLDEKGEISPAGGEWENGFVSTQIREFGKYMVLVDTLAPEMRSLDLDGSGGPINRRTLRFKVTDKGSGIKSYEGYIDNEWALFEYDMKNDLVFYRIDRERLVQGKNHELELYIIDNKENIAYYYAEFYW